MSFLHLVVLGHCLFASRGALAATVEPQLNAAAGNLTTLDTVIAPSWANSANVRGTSDILWSCIVTLTACVYTAMHLNVPAKHHSHWAQFRGKVKWAMISLVAPELVLHTALKQFNSARELRNDLNALRDKSSESKDPTETLEMGQSLLPSAPQGKMEPFNLAYGFWVVMGGFVVDTNDIHDTYSRLTLGPSGVKLLAQEGLFLGMPDEAISAQSKGNVFAKALVLIQVGWMVVQCIARKAASYPLTLLEIHTMVHVVCALCIYGLWWHKPLDVEEATVVEASTHRELIALMVMESGPVRNWKAPPFRESACVQLYPEEEATRNRQPPGRHPDSPTVIQHCKFPRNISEENTQRKDNMVVTLRSGEALECGLGPYMNKPKGEIKAEPTIGIQLDLSKKDVQRWELAAMALRQLNALPGRTALTWNWIGTRYYGIELGLSPSAPNIISDLNPHEKMFLMSDYVVAFMLVEKGLLLSGVLLPILYGGIHLSAWAFEFPSHAESLIWKIACIGIMGAIPFQWLSNQLRWSTPLAVWGLTYLLLGWVFWLTVLFYAFCRVFIVLEAFLSLRSVPLGVYAAVPWVQSIPHL